MHGGTPTGTVASSHYCAFRSSVGCMDTTQLLKGVLDLAVLAVVDDEDGYGYDVVRRLRAGGLDDVGDASVYGTLRRLYAAGALTSYVVPVREGPHRKYYGITPAGRDPAQAAARRLGRTSPAPSPTCSQEGPPMNAAPQPMRRRRAWPPSSPQVRPGSPT